MQKEILCLTDNNLRFSPGLWSALSPNCYSAPSPWSPSSEPSTTSTPLSPPLAVSQALHKARQFSLPGAAKASARHHSPRFALSLLAVHKLTLAQAIAKQFALAGSTHITITGRALDALTATKHEIEALAPTCKLTAIAADLTSEQAVTDLFTALPTGAPPDVVVNNAGVSLAQARIADSDPEAWWRDWEVNVKATYLVTRAWLRLRSQTESTGQGVVLNVSSSVGDLVAPNMGSYGTAKMAVNRFTEAVQLEYGPLGVRCVAFHPGGIASTGMGQAAPEQFRARLIDTVDLAAGTALYLSTPEAGFLDGRFVYANWDMERVERLKEDIVRDNLLVSRINYGESLSTEVEGLPPP